MAAVLVGCNQGKTAKLGASLVGSGCEDGEISGSNSRDLGKFDELMERFKMSLGVLI
jgi:hypothetical protein